MNLAALLPGKYYYIYNRGNNKEDIFKEPGNYFYFLQLWGKYIDPIAESYAYCLLKNHFHFLVRIREENNLQLLNKKMSNLNEEECYVADCSRLISKQFSNLFNSYTKAINKSYSREGSLFQERFKRKEVSDEVYFSSLVYYIHANPMKHGLIKDFKEWPHSSYHSILSNKPSKLQREKVLEWFSGERGYIEFHLANDAFLEDWDDD